MLNGKKVAILATDGFEQSELMEPHRALVDAGADVKVVSLKSGTIRGVKGLEWSESVNVNLVIDDAAAEDFDALVLPGGVYNPDILRTEDKAVKFVRDMVQADKPVAAICHGPWLLIEAGVIRGRRATSYHSIRTDMINAGAEWVDEAVVVYNGLVTSRSPEDLDQFCRKIVEEIGEGRHRQRDGTVLETTHT